MKKSVTLLLAAFPLLHIYCLPGLTSWPISYIFCIFLFIFCLSKGKTINYELPVGFKPYWLYIAIIYILLAHNFGFGLFIPGGYSFFMWVILFWLCNSFIDYNKFKKYYRVIFCICSAAFLFQEFCYYTMGSRPLFMLPLPFYGVDKSEILMNQMLLDRSSSFFIEPSHFAQFTLPLLAIEIFENSKYKFLNYFSVFVIAVLLLLQSGNGMVGIMILLGIRLATYFKQTKGKYKYFTLYAFLPLLGYCAYIYAGTEIGNGLLERASNVGLTEESESSTRIVKGFLLYSEMPLFNKIFGYHIDDIENFAISSRLSYLFLSKVSGEYSLYLNGFQHVLIINGLIGMFLFLKIWVNLYLNNDILSKSLIIVFIVLLFISNLYIGQMMLICMLLPFNQKQKKIIQ